MILSEKALRIRKTEVTIPCHLGIHARNAVCFIRFTKQFLSEIRLRKGTLVADGRSILGILVLGASWNSKLQIEIEGPDADIVVKAVEAYFRTDEHCADDDAMKRGIR